MKPENRGDVLGVLRDNCGVDGVLLGTAKTGNSIEQLQEYLASKGMTQLRVRVESNPRHDPDPSPSPSPSPSPDPNPNQVITPEREYQISRSSLP